MKRELAKCSGFDFGIGRGNPMLMGHFEYDGGGGQGIGRRVDAGFLMEFLGVFRVDRLSKVNGRSCWVTHDDDGIAVIEPLHQKGGESFNIILYHERAVARAEEEAHNFTEAVGLLREWAYNDEGDPVTVHERLDEFLIRMGEK